MIGPLGYEILDELGRGAMAVVYRARQSALDKHVALKVMKSQGAMSPTLLVRMHREGKALGVVRHPNLVEVYDTGDVDGRPYIAMELVVGRTLKSCLQDEPIETRRPHAERSAVVSINGAQPGERGHQVQGSTRPRRNLKRQRRPAIELSAPGRPSGSMSRHAR